MYGALNRLEEAVNHAGKAAKYQYNGLGHRVGRQEGIIPKEQLERMDPQSRIKAETEIGNWNRISYTIDPTREYHNLLERSEGDSIQTYFWDGNVASYEANGERNYYLQDELGSPLRIEDEAGRTRESYGYGALGGSFIEGAIVAGVSAIPGVGAIAVGGGINSALTQYGEDGKIDWGVVAEIV